MKFLLTVLRRWSQCCSHSVWLCGFILRSALRFKVFPCCLSSCFVSPFNIVITSLGVEGAGLCASRAFVCFVRFSFCYFSLPFCVGGWLRFVIVALPGLFYYFVLPKPYGTGPSRPRQLVPYPHFGSPRYIV